MAEQPMKPLSQERQDAGTWLLKLTDDYGFAAHAAGWLYDLDRDDYQFILTTPMVDTQGPRWIFERLHKMFRHHPMPPGISPLEIMVIDTVLEIALFGAPLFGFDDKGMPSGLRVIHNLDFDGRMVRKGGITFYRRLPEHLRHERRNTARTFDLRVSKLAA